MSVYIHIVFENAILRVGQNHEQNRQTVMRGCPQCLDAVHRGAVTGYSNHPARAERVGDPQSTSDTLADTAATKAEK